MILYKWHEIEIPADTLRPEQLAEAAIRASLLVYAEPSYVAWAIGWLSGRDRSQAAAHAATARSRAAAWAKATAQAAAITLTKQTTWARTATQAAAAHTAVEAARAGAHSGDLAAIAAQVFGVFGRSL